MAVMTMIPFMCYLILPSPYDSIAAMTSNIGMIFVFWRLVKGMGKNILGSSKGKWSCLSCQWTKFDKTGHCQRCGGSARRML